MDGFRALLLDISQHLKTDDLERLKFACSGFIPAGRAEFIRRPHELFLELERMGKLSEENRDFLAVTFTKIGRNDLRNKLLQIPEAPLYDDRQRNRETTTEPYSQRVSSEIVLEIADKISTSWKFLGRYLKIPHHTISNIDDTYRKTEEKSYEMLMKWSQTSHSATALELLRALDKCGRRDLAELVESREGSGARPTENMNTPEQRQFPDMRDLQDNLPYVPDSARRTQVPVQHDLNNGPSGQRRQNRQPDDAFTDQPNAEPDVANASPDPRHPVQVTDLDDLKKPGVLDKDKYVITESLGKGGFSEVLCVLEKSSNKYFAVKTVDLGANDRTTVEKVEALEKEIKLLTVLDNPYVIKYYRTYSDTHSLALFMEYMPGGSIAQQVTRLGLLEEEIVRKYTRQLLKGLKYLHENKVIHRNIKGANILLDDSQEHVKLSDFGISICMEGIATSTGKCMSNQYGLFASVFWTSPELLGSEKHSYNTDIWSLGCTVVEMLTGNPPFRTKNAVMVQVINKIYTGCVKPPEECSSLAKVFLDRCFQKMPDRPSAKTILESSEFPSPQVD